MECPPFECLLNGLILNCLEEYNRHGNLLCKRQTNRADDARKCHSLDANGCVLFYIQNEGELLENSMETRIFNSVFFFSSSFVHFIFSQCFSINATFFCFTYLVKHFVFISEAFFRRFNNFVRWKTTIEFLTKLTYKWCEFRGWTK